MTFTGTLRRPARTGTALLLALLVLSACAPTSTTSPSPAATAEQQALERTAYIVYHRMAIGYLETGTYTTNVLVDVALPQGVRWTLLEYPQDRSSYTLRLTSDAVEGQAYRVSPAGVRLVAVR
jgi:outer membrane lipoprotein-sorting protein